MLSLLAASGCKEAATGASGGAGGATASTSNASTSTVGSNVGSTSTTKASSSSSGMPFVCDPPAAPGSLYEKDALLQFEVDRTSMCQYRGQVLLIVNTAAI